LGVIFAFPASGEELLEEFVEPVEVLLPFDKGLLDFPVSYKQSVLEI
jgi:hypothetical protein